MKPCHLLLLLTLALPPVAMAAPPGHHVIQWTSHVYGTTALTGWDGDTLNVNLTRPHSWTVVSTDVDVLFTISVGVTGSNVQREFTMAVDGVTLDFCRQTISTGGALAQRFAYGGGPYCPGTNNGVERIQVGVQQTWTFNNSGTATVEFIVANVQALVQEVVEMELTITSAFDFWIPMLALAGGFYYAYLRGLQRHAAWGFPLVILLLGILTLSLGDTWPEALRVPPDWAIIASTLWLLFMYGIQGAGMKNLRGDE